MSLPNLIRAAAVLSVTMTSAALAQDTSPKIKTSQQAIDRIFDRNLLIDRDSTRLIEFFDRNIRGERTWTMNFVSDQDSLSVKFDDAADVKHAKKGERSPIYRPDFHNGLPKVQGDLGADARLTEAREALRKQFPDAVIEDDYIMQFRFCFAPQEGKTSKYENGCRRKGPLSRWKVWLKMTPAEGDWLAKEVFFGDEATAVVKDGPRGYFQ